MCGCWRWVSVLCPLFRLNKLINVNNNVIAIREKTKWDKEWTKKSTKIKIMMMLMWLFRFINCRVVYLCSPNKNVYMRMCLCVHVSILPFFHFWFCDAFFLSAMWLNFIWLKYFITLTAYICATSDSIESKWKYFRAYVCNLVTVNWVLYHCCCWCCCCYCVLTADVFPLWRVFNCCMRTNSHQRTRTCIHK